MKPALKISETVIKRLTNVQEKCLGSLYGVFYNKTQFIIGLCVNDDDENFGIDQYFPTEVELCGLFEVNEPDQFDHTKLKNAIENIIITDNPLYLKVTLGVENVVESAFILNNKLETATAEVITEEDLYSQFFHIRLKAQLPLICSPDEENIKDALQEMRYNFEGKVIFHFQKQQVFLLESGVSGLSSDCTVGELSKRNLSTDSSSWHDHISHDIIQADMYKKVSQEINAELKKNHAPIVCVDKKKYESLVMVLNLDALSMVNRNMPLKSIYEILVGSMYRNIVILQRTIVKHFQQSGGDHSKISYPQIFHFYPKECGHFITRVYAKNESECSLEPERKNLHSRLLLPRTSPMFRRANKFLFKGEQYSNQILSNPHDGLKPTTNGGDIAIVKGVYQYYHYCQDKMDDDGWGCAYRSLQTLASWFHLQGYTEKPVPTFKDIQKCLVDIGDKQSSFIGSKQWIGSTEVNFVLNSLLDVTCKILYCSSGEDVAGKVPELLNHFQVHGSPIMIGGGVLAHTILGVDYNRQTGGIKFLILDPHYTGSENLHIIQSKGWVGWKGIEFWNKTAYYNMCLPQVPQCV